MLHTLQCYLVSELAQVVMSYVPVDVVIAATDTALLYRHENTWHTLQHCTLPSGFIWSCGTHYVCLDDNQVYRYYTLSTGAFVIIPTPDELKIRDTVCECNNTIYLFGRSDPDIEPQVGLMYYLDRSTVTWVRLPNLLIERLLTSIGLSDTLYCVEQSDGISRLYQYTVLSKQWKFILSRTFTCIYLCSFGNNVCMLGRYAGVMYNVITHKIKSVNPTTIIPHASFGYEYFDFYTAGGVTYAHDYTGDDYLDSLFTYAGIRYKKVCDLPSEIKWTFQGSISATLL